MKITPERNVDNKKKNVAWFTIDGKREHREQADVFLKSLGVELSQCTTDTIDDEFYTSFPWFVYETKAKDMKYMRKLLKEFYRGSK